MDVVVYDSVAVLKVLPFADAVGRDQQVEFTVTIEVLWTLF